MLRSWTNWAQLIQQGKWAKKRAQICTEESALILSLPHLREIQTSREACKGPQTFEEKTSPTKRKWEPVGCEVTRVTHSWAQSNRASYSSFPPPELALNDADLIYWFSAPLLTSALSTCSTFCKACSYLPRWNDKACVTPNDSRQMGSRHLWRKRHLPFILAAVIRGVSILQSLSPEHSTYWLSEPTFARFQSQSNTKMVPWCIHHQFNVTQSLWHRPAQLSASNHQAWPQKHHAIALLACLSASSIKTMSWKAFQLQQ